MQSYRVSGAGVQEEANEHVNDVHRPGKGGSHFDGDGEPRPRRGAGVHDCNALQVPQTCMTPGVLMKATEKKCEEFDWKSYCQGRRKEIPLLRAHFEIKADPERGRK